MVKKMYEIQSKKSTKAEVETRNKIFESYESINQWLKRKSAKSKTGKLSNMLYNKFIMLMEQYVNFVDNKTTETTPDTLIENAITDSDSAIMSLKQFYHHLVQSGYSKATARNYVSHIVTFFRYNKTLLNEPISIPLPPKRASTIREWGFTKEEIEKLVSVSNIRDKAIVLCMSSSGISEADLFNIKIKTIKPYLIQKDNKFTVDTEKVAIIHIERKKTGVSYHTCFSEEAMKSLVIYINSRKISSTNEYLFVKEGRSRAGKNGLSQQVTQNAFDRTFSRACANAGIIDEMGSGHQTGKTPHRLRSYFNTTLKRNGANTEFVEYMMGHSIGVSGFYMTDPWETISEFYKKFESVLAIQTTKTDNSIKTVKDALEIVANQFGVTTETIAKRSQSDGPMNNAESIRTIGELLYEAIQKQINKK